MIYDSLENLAKYNVVSKNVLDFLDNLSIDIKTGKYVIDDNTYVNVEIYNTKSPEVCFFESHKKYIDIQTVVTGKEKIEVIDTHLLKVKTAYDETADIMFYHNPLELASSVVIEKGKFAMLYPHEAHRPQLRVNNISSTVKKAVVKIKVV